MKKVFDQTVRDLKREVNKKVLKVPGIEQKVLDATSNEPWGPHGTLLADIAQASRNYHEYQMIMIVLWKRINDTGKNWRHVYKALTVLEYMVANGSERVIDEIREHVYQIQTLSNFQYIDSSGRDQGNNVRRKSQALVALANDKERIAEVREKAAANRDKFRSSSSAGGMYRPGSYPDARYADEGRGGGRDDDKYDYGRERDWGSRDGDSYRDGDRYGRESEERYGRGSYRDDEYRGRSRSTDNYQYKSRSRSSDRERERAYEDDGNYSSRDSGARAEESLERRLERKFSEQNIGAPPSYEEAVSEARSPGLSERNGENQAAPVPKTSPPPPSSSTVPQTNAPNFASPPQQEFETFDEFDPRIPVSAPPATSVSPGVDLFGSDSFNPLALALVDYPTTSEVAPPSAGPTFSAASQPFDDPFGDGPFKANPLTDPAQTASFQSTATTQIPKAETVPNYGFGQSPLSDLSYAPNDNYTTTPSTGFAPQPLSAPNTDMYGGGPLPPSAQASGYHPQPGSQPPPPHMQPHSNYYNQGSFQQQGPVLTSSSYQVPNYGSSTSQAGASQSFMTSQPPPALTASSGALALVPQQQQQQQPSKDKFETKSTVWADTLSRGLVDLNISGSKANPMGDIGVDFEALNRKERRMEKSTANNTPIMSTITMGKAMGSGTGMGRGGAAALRPPMVGMGMGMGMVMGGGAPGYRGMAQQPPPMGMGMGMGMNPGMTQGGGGGQMQRPGGGYTYTPMMGPPGGGSYNQQQPYGGGGYR